MSKTKDRTSIYFSKETRKKLKKLAVDLGLSMPDTVNFLIDEFKKKNRY